MVQERINVSGWDDTCPFPSVKRNLLRKRLTGIDRVASATGKLEALAEFCEGLAMRKTCRKAPPPGSHQWIDLVNLQMCRAIARKIRRQPSLMHIPRGNLRRWERKNGSLLPAHREWREILDHNPMERVLKILTQNTDEGQRLRQSDPFVGVLTEKERLAFFKFDETIAA
jgi:hypothetical protein